MEAKIIVGVRVSNDDEKGYFEKHFEITKEDLEHIAYSHAKGEFGDKYNRYVTSGEIRFILH